MQGLSMRLLGSPHYYQRLLLVVPLIMIFVMGIMASPDCLYAPLSNTARTDYLQSDRVAILPMTMPLAIISPTRGATTTAMSSRHAAIVLTIKGMNNSLRSSSGELPAIKVKAVNYRSRARSAAKALQQGWYNQNSGLWDGTHWWNAANALNALIDYMDRTGSRRYRDTISITYDKNDSKRFLNNFYDDEGWWGNTWVRAYDLTGDARYLVTARIIFGDMTRGWTSRCGGGLVWAKDRTYKNAIPNELFLLLAVRLHDRTRGDHGRGSFLDWAKREWTWFKASGLINERGLVNDGLTDSCRNNGETTWTYNQGVILAGLIGLSRDTGDNSLVRQAQSIADATTRDLVDTHSVLREPCEPTCDSDAPTFKGVFMRNLDVLYQVTHKRLYAHFIAVNADALWMNDRDSSNRFGLEWDGPLDSIGASRQQSALDALTAAIDRT